MHARVNNQQTFYDVLDVSPFANDHDIKLAYRRLVLYWHPDRRIHAREVAEENLKLINEAYAHIKSKAARSQYNQILKLQHKAQAYTASENVWNRFWDWMLNKEGSNR